MCSPLLADTAALSSSAMMGDTIIFSITSVDGEEGDQVCVDITVENFTNVSTGTIQLNFDPTVMCLVCPPENLELSCFNENGANNLTPSTFNCNFIESGFVRFLWISDPLTFDNDCLIARFCFDLNGNAGDCSPVSIQNNFLEIVYDDGTTANVITNDGEVCITPTELSCREGHCNPSFTDNGSLYFWGVGGTGPYTFDVNGGFATGTLDEFEEFQLDNLPSGLYTVTITDAVGNSCSMSINLFDSSDYPMSIELSALPTTCFDATNGIVRIDTIAGGISGLDGACGSFDYEIEWSNGLFNIDSLNRVEEGLYCVTVTDFFGCRQIECIDISVDTLFVEVQIIQEPSCNGAADGIIVVCASGGTPGAGGVYDFELEGVDPGNFYDDDLTGVVKDTFFGIPNGTYEIIALDYARIPCISDPIIVEFDSGPNFMIDIISDQDSCSGGLATVQFCPTVDGTYLPTLIDTVTGATIPTGNLGGKVTATLPPGTYNITMDEFFTGCFTDSTFIVPDIDELIVIVDAEDPTCSGNDGSVELMVSGGTEPYNFQWNIDNLDGPIRTGLDGGEYTITITDANGCEVIVPPITLADGDSIPINAFIVQAVSCSGAEDGIVGATVNNSITYTYSWSDGTNDLGNSETLENLGSGTYFVTAVDADGCQATDSIFLANPDSDIAIDVSQTGPSCSNSDDGNLSPIVNSGAGPFTFTWQDPDTEEVLLVGQVFTGGVGDYLLTIEDALGCSFDTLLTMALPPNAIILTSSNITGVSCFGTCDGQVTLEAITGMSGAPFIYVVNGGTPMNSTGPVTFTDVCAGMAWALAVDATCISDTLFFEIPDQDVVGIDSIASEFIPPSCTGDSDGSITLALEGVDIADATITWIGQGVTGPTITGLPAGTYEVEIAYGAGCIITDEVTLTDPPVLVVEIDNLVTRGIGCSNDSDGVVGVIVSGGNPGAYTYNWSPNVSTSEIANELGPGLYEVTVTDVNGCSDSTSYLMTSAPPVEFTLPTPAPPACNGEQTCIEITSASGGTGGPYTFSVNNGLRIDIDTCLNLFAGEYLIAVFDEGGCGKDTVIVIDQPEELTVQAGPDQVINVGEESGPVSAQIVSFLPVDTIAWSPSATLRSETMDNQVVTAFPAQSTSYIVTVTDEAGCTATSDVLIEVEFRRNVYFPSGFSPNNDDVNDRFQPIVGIGVELVNSFSVYDRWGNRVYRQEGFVPDPVANTGWDGRYNNTLVTPGVYVYYAEVTFVDGVTIQYAGDITVVR